MKSSFNLHLTHGRTATTTPCQVMQIRLTEVSGQTVTVDGLSANSTVWDIKNKYETLQKFPIENQQLFFGGVRLEDDKRTLLEYNLGRDSIVVVRFARMKVRGFTYAVCPDVSLLRHFGGSRVALLLVIPGGSVMHTSVWCYACGTNFIQRNDQFAPYRIRFSRYPIVMESPSSLSCPGKSNANSSNSIVSLVYIGIYTLILLRKPRQGPLTRDHRVLGKACISRISFVIDKKRYSASRYLRPVQITAFSVFVYVCNPRESMSFVMTRFELCLPLGDICL